METILLVVIAYFALAYLYTFIMTIVGLFYKEVNISKTDRKHKYSIVIPAYKEDAVIAETALTAVRQQYEKNLFDVFVISDQLKASTNKLIEEFGATVIKVEFDKSTKVKSLARYAELYGNNADYTIILDADNCIEPTFLNEINDKINKTNAEVIQVQRKSKNHNTGISFLDAFSEYANTMILSKGPNLLKLSSKLSGSGMILQSEIFTDLISTMNGISGFDKEMELKLTKSNIYIHYLDAPYVLDEKLVNHSQIKTQRSRWIYAQFDYLRKFFISGLVALFTGKLDHAHKVFQLALPPRVLGVLALVILNIVSIILNNDTVLNSILIVDLLFISSYIILFFLFSRKHKMPKGLLLEMFKITFGYIQAFKYFKRAGKEFLHTKHNI